MNIRIEEGWKSALSAEFEKDYFSDIKKALLKAKKDGKVVYPSGNKIFNAYDTTPFDKVKVVVLGQDPYHNPDEAMGLSFSVPQGKRIPPSLRNIYKELHQDVGVDIPSHGDLTSWAEQGVFLLNAMLTVEQNSPSSHKNIGWQHFTNASISALSEHREHVVFLLWGNFAKKKASLIDESKHLVLASAHPSPLAGKKFFDNQHFSKANTYLTKHGHQPIDWHIG